MKVTITRSGRESLQRIYTYFRLKGAGMKGREVRKRVIEISKLLAENPKMGQKEENLEHLEQEHRSIPIKPVYKVIYRIIDQTIFITDVFDTRQDPEKMKS